MSDVFVNQMLIEGDKQNLERLNLKVEEGIVYLGGDEFEGRIEDDSPDSVAVQIVSQNGPPLEMLRNLSKKFAVQFDIQWANGGVFQGVGADIWGRALIRDGTIERTVVW